jgi:hypothetical protein
VRHRSHADDAVLPYIEDTMNILLWYLPFAMFTETCDLVISECKAQPDSTQPLASPETHPGEPRKGPARSA